MTLDEDSQEHLGEVVQACMEAIYEGTSSRGSAASGAATSEAQSDLGGSRIGRGLDADDLNIGKSPSEEDERKYHDM